MEVFGWICTYLFLAFFCYFCSYAIAVDESCRLNLPCQEDEGIWQAFIALIKGAFDLLVFDFLKIHCPWNWKTAVTHRVQEAHRLLQNITHEKGWTVSDCHDPANHEQIANECFQSRLGFWTTECLKALSMPIRYILIIPIFLILGI